MQYIVSAATLLALVQAAAAQTAGFDAIYAPHAEEVLQAGSTYTVRWQPANWTTGTVKIDILGGTSPSTLEDHATMATGIDNSLGQWTWNILASSGVDAYYGLKLIWEADETVFQYSFPFHIAGSDSATTTTTTTSAGPTDSVPTTTSEGGDNGSWGTTTSTTSTTSSWATTSSSGAGYGSGSGVGAGAGAGSWGSSTLVTFTSTLAHGGAPTIVSAKPTGGKGAVSNSGSTAGYGSGSNSAVGAGSNAGVPAGKGSAATTGGVSGSKAGSSPVTVSGAGRVAGSLGLAAAAVVAFAL